MRARLDELDAHDGRIPWRSPNDAGARANQAEVHRKLVRSCRPLISTIPEVEDLADYCRALKAFASCVRQAARRLQGTCASARRAGLGERTCWAACRKFRLDLVCASSTRWRWSLLLTRIDERLNEEKQKLSALDFDDLELRALELLERPEVMTRAAERYKFFLVDEFQDTNGLQRVLLERLALQKARRDSANLFIVGDRKQSIYGFRGADVAVFSEMTDDVAGSRWRVETAAAELSQPAAADQLSSTISSSGCSKPAEEVSPTQELSRAGLCRVTNRVKPKRELRDSGPLVELMITTEASGNEDDPKAEQTSRELDAEQLALRIISLVDAGSAGILPASHDYSSS